MPIAGENITDHNIITATINLETEIKSRNTKQWKQGTSEQWEKYNTEVKKEWIKTSNKKRNTQTLQTIMKKAMTLHIGTKTCKTNQKTKITNPEIKKAKQAKKEANNHSRKHAKKSTT
jgi:hypothetical protein